MVDRTGWRAMTGTVGMAVLRALTAAAVLLSADIHLEMWATGFRNIPVIGPLFLLNTAGGLVLGIALLVGRYRLVALAAALFGAATLAAFTVAATTGLYGVQESLSGAPERLSVVAESVAIVGGVLLATLPPRLGQGELPHRTKRAVLPAGGEHGDLAERTGRGGLPAGADPSASRPPGNRDAPATEHDTPIEAGTADADGARSSSAALDAEDGGRSGRATKHGARTGHGWRRGARLGR
ncbi:hypothetical protein [Actinocatenispora sera]|uniref:Uncharacterized protein n=1 Tax=Actinocatenispora sera TaxID=390989 RepID=A0A810L588_9ACTN|nr:hypothetical protein [Actinocatenispora sera]BCJ30397.1 hypothetical protein Asera_45050 [Actinocatenispora sera]